MKVKDRYMFGGLTFWVNLNQWDQQREYSYYYYQAYYLSFRLIRKKKKIGYGHETLEET